jgi:hypothetical protein
MTRIGPAIPVEEEAALIHLIFPGPFPSFDHRHRRDRQRHLRKNGGLNPDYPRTPGLPTRDFFGRQGRPTTAMSQHIAEEA